MKMVTSWLLDGSRLDSVLDEERTSRFHSLLRQYYEEVREERPALTEREPPRGIADVQRHVRMIEQGSTPDYTDTYLFGCKAREKVPFGFVSFYETDEVWQETHWVVHEDYRGEGLGTQLMEATAGRAARNDKQLRVYNPTGPAYDVLRTLQERYPIEIREEDDV